MYNGMWNAAPDADDHADAKDPRAMRLFQLSNARYPFTTTVEKKYGIS